MTIEQVKAACRHALELSEKATPGPWKKTGSTATDIQCGPLGAMAYVSTAGARGRSLQEAQHNGSFIARSRIFTPAAAQALLTAIGALEFTVVHSAVARQDCRDALLSIADNFPEI